MKYRLFLLNFILALMITISSSSAIGVYANTDNYIIETDKLVMEVRGGAQNPFFFFYEPGNDTVTYKFALDQVFEIIDNNNNTEYDYGNDTIVPQSQLSLSSLEWEFSEVDVVTNDLNETQSMHFNVTALGDKADGGNGNFTGLDFYIQFRMHIDVSNTTRVKFDVVINEYAFKDLDAMLVIAFKLTTTQNEHVVRANNTFQFGQGYFDSVDFANDSFGESKVGMSNSFADGQNRIYLAYEQFNGTLIHDPILGLNAIDNPISTISTDPTDISDSTSDDTSTINVDTNISSDQTVGKLPTMSKGQLFASNTIAIAAFLLVPVIAYRFKKQ
ncbi:MAG: hypothetical protein INQ03_15650 [Candidatus Heimdallarchaeota archaeon]|nr:hypothetical protein [Candidatus Heimdallarchaeota archaeon]